MSDRSRRGSGFSSGGRRSALGYWLPLAVTVGVATVGLAAWIWSERNDDDDDENLGYGEGVTPIKLDPSGTGSSSRGVTSAAEFGSRSEDVSVTSRVQDALRRTPSPQQLFDGASKKVAAGMAAAGAVMSGALASIREEDREQYEEHTPRLESEAAARDGPASRGSAQTTQQPPPITLVDSTAKSAKRRKTVAIVVASVPRGNGEHDHDQDPELESALVGHYSILSTLPQYVTRGAERVMVFIYAPGIANATLSARPTPSGASSYSNIATEEATEMDEPMPVITIEQDRSLYTGTYPYYKTLFDQARDIVDDQTLILPFNQPSGHVPLLRHMSPDIVYIQAGLTGDEGELVQQIAGYVRQVVVITGDDFGCGALMDSDDESQLADSGERKWWEKENALTASKRITTVKASHIGRDWRQRVCGEED
ncbi:hypothetical protein FQN57_000156 [Myotisia sp. PD_48]|nr:hypothetical protein FQN57_000156 [Myotisia sp. PD_48]